MKVLGHTKSAPLIKEMLEHETEHLKKFEELLVQYDVRPTVLVPLWRLAGFTLGAGCNAVMKLLGRDQSGQVVDQICRGGYLLMRKITEKLDCFEEAASSDVSIVSYACSSP